MKRDEVCSNCRFWERWQHECRVLSPSFIPQFSGNALYVSNDDPLSGWPETDPADWCGEFQRLQPEDKIA